MSVDIEDFEMNFDIKLGLPFYWDLLLHLTIIWARK